MHQWIPVLEIVARNRAVTRTWVGELIRCELPTVSPVTGTGSLKTRHFNHGGMSCAELPRSPTPTGAWALLPWCCALSTRHRFGPTQVQASSSIHRGGSSSSRPAIRTSASQGLSGRSMPKANSPLSTGQAGTGLRRTRMGTSRTRTSKRGSSSGARLGSNGPGDITPGRRWCRPMAAPSSLTGPATSTTPAANRPNGAGVSRSLGCHRRGN
jgi:hypothetical protein